MLETREHTRDALIALGSAKLSDSFLNILGASLVRGYPADGVVRYIKPVALVRVTISPGELAISMSSPCLERTIVSAPSVIYVGRAAFTPYLAPSCTVHASCLGEGGVSL